MNNNTKPGWWGIAVGITILKKYGVPSEKVKDKIIRIIDYIYSAKQGEDHEKRI